MNRLNFLHIVILIQLTKINFSTSFRISTYLDGGVPVMVSEPLTNSSMQIECLWRTKFISPLKTVTCQAGGRNYSFTNAFYLQNSVHIAYAISFSDGKSTDS